MAEGTVAGMFSRIARSYDALNRIFSLGSDQRWRRILVRLARAGPDAEALDVCCGTAELALALVRGRAAARVVGVDLSGGMLAMGDHKIRREGVGSRVSLLLADALNLPFPGSSFDVACNAFGLRNLPDRARGIREMARVLRPGGRLLVLEFARPRPGPAGRLFRWYLSTLIPLVGGIVSGEEQAYRYLRQSIVSFLEPGEVAGLMRDAGLQRVRTLPLTAGIAFLYWGSYPPRR